MLKLLWRFMSRQHSEDQKNNNTYSDETKRMVNLLMLRRPKRSELNPDWLVTIGHLQVFNGLRVAKL